MHLRNFLVFSVFLGIGLFCSFAQNLVPNPSFETASSIPNSSGDWSFCTGWNNVNLNMGSWPYATPDYFHTSGTGGGNAPNTAFGTAAPQDGNALIGLYSKHSSQLNSRDYMAAQLTAPLTVGNTYEISFWMTSGSGNYYYGSSCSHMGIQLSMAPLVQTQHENTGGTPQAEVAGDPWLPSWTFYSFSYVATNPYQYVTIGNFHNDASTTTTVHAPGANFASAAYYFFDNIVIQETVVLPIQLLSFEARNERQHVVLSWATSAEINNDYFTVERSTDMKTWNEIGTVDGAGNSSESLSYQLIDFEPESGVSYYRLRQTDFNGAQTTSDVRSIRRVDLEALKVFPIPAQDQLIVEGEQTEIENFTLLNAQGTDVTHAVAFQKSHTPNTLILDVRALPAGVYLLQTALHTERVVLL